jgi:hypothetical protein
MLDDRVQSVDAIALPSKVGWRDRGGDCCCSSAAAVVLCWLVVSVVSLLGFLVVFFLANVEVNPDTNFESLVLPQRLVDCGDEADSVLSTEWKPTKFEWDSGEFG